MLSLYQPGERYTWHLDNPRRENGRVLTCVYYLNADWSEEMGGALRLIQRSRAHDLGAACASASASLAAARSGGDDEGHQATEMWRVLAEVQPALDTLVAFWSDEIPHEVLPPIGSASRRAISVWYLCPRLGVGQFVDGSPQATSSQSPRRAAAEVLSRSSPEDQEAFHWLRKMACCDDDGDG
eukprot:TRINITY_DN39955_c0_g1_i1.p1 TRINITY_DN39955_c0_g1~~TRINITY_DN39955_c0_g1_i1.p1  ORF type:complete len:183 (-),score=31.43 TRINITY_DN39955_c0_g1_i1:2-550(-)